MSTIHPDDDPVLVAYTLIVIVVGILVLIALGG